MRRLNAAGRRARALGLTLIEIMVTLTIGALVLTFAAPHMGDYYTNTRMREGMHIVMAQALFAQSEALKRNAPVRLTVTPTEASVSLVSNNMVIRTQALINGVEASAGTLDFGANGLPTPLGATLQVVVSQAGVTCSADLRCPRLNIDGGGGLRNCSDTTNCP